MLYLIPNQNSKEWFFKMTKNHRIYFFVRLCQIHFLLRWREIGDDRPEKYRKLSDLKKGFPKNTERRVEIISTIIKCNTIG